MTIRPSAKIYFGIDYLWSVNGDAYMRPRTKSKIDVVFRPTFGSRDPGNLSAFYDFPLPAKLVRYGADGSIDVKFITIQKVRHIATDLLSAGAFDHFWPNRTVLSHRTLILAAPPKRILRNAVKKRSNKKRVQKKKKIRARTAA